MRYVILEKVNEDTFRVRSYKPSYNTPWQSSFTTEQRARACAKVLISLQKRHGYPAAPLYVAKLERVV